MQLGMQLRQTRVVDLAEVLSAHDSRLIVIGMADSSLLPVKLLVKG